MIKTYKYKLKPTVKQQKLLMQTFGCVRFIYNWGLQMKMQAYKEEKKTLTSIDLAKTLTSLKKETEYKWLNTCAAEALQQSLRHLDNAYTSFFKAKKGFPKFKSKHYSKRSASFMNATINFDTWLTRIPRIGKVKTYKNRTFDHSKVKVGTATVSMDSCGEFWLTILTDDFIDNPPRAKVDNGNAVGIDLGIKDFATLSDGTKIPNPKFLERSARRLKKLQRKFSKAQKGSKNRERLRLKIARLHRLIANRRNDFLHKLSTKLVKQYDTICMENLNIEGMLKNHKLARAISSVAWTEFVRQLSYKCAWHGKNLVFIGRFEPSSKTCSVCGHIYNELTLSERTWTCSNCGTVHDRDINAAINVKHLGLHPSALVAIENKIPSGSGIEQDGEG